MSAKTLARFGLTAERMHLHPSSRQQLEERLVEAERRLTAVEELRVRQAENAEFYAAMEDHVRAAVLLHSSAELRQALTR